MYLSLVALPLVVLSGLAFRPDALINTSAAKPKVIIGLILIILFLINRRLVFVFYSTGKEIIVRVINRAANHISMAHNTAVGELVSPIEASVQTLLMVHVNDSFGNLGGFVCGFAILSITHTLKVKIACEFAQITC
jgi:hypothetical protein